VISLKLQDFGEH